MKHVWLALVASIALAVVAGATGPARAENIDPVGDDHQFAWGENVGWINAEPSGDGGPGAEVGDFQLTGWLWGENVGWISLSCDNTASCGDADYRVANDGFGGLSGFAWSENVGWIAFAPAGCEPDPTCGVSIDPATGYFHGRAWGENVGWVTFSSGAPIGSTARTSWCAATGPPPGPGISLTVGKSGSDLSLAWTASPDASWYDVVTGSVSDLLASGGDFGVATKKCAVRRLTTTSIVQAEADPPPGGVTWLLVRGANCRGHGTYDTGGAGQTGARDAEIAASSADCP
jgi:hypothetical protein